MNRDLCARQEGQASDLKAHPFGAGTNLWWQSNDHPFMHEKSITKSLLISLYEDPFLLGRAQREPQKKCCIEGPTKGQYGTRKEGYVASGDQILRMAHLSLSVQTGNER